MERAMSHAPSHSVEKVSRVDTVGKASVVSQISLAFGKPTDDHDKDSRSFDSLSSDSRDGPSKSSVHRKIAVRRAVDGWISSTLEKGVSGIAQEYMRIRKDVDPRELTAFRIANSLGKNRFGDIGCLDCSRVVLRHSSGEYIHANYVASPRSSRRFICTQAPMETTAVDFWRMVVQERVQKIVMLCDFFEQNLSKCAVYFPVEKGQTLQFENYEIVNHDISEIGAEEGTYRYTITVTALRVKSTSGTQKVLHYFVRDWADRRVCSPRLICRLLTEIRSSDKPIVVHCSSGVGRSGTMIAVELVLEKLIAGESNVDCERVLNQIRRQRACAVSTDAQYLFVHRVVLHYLEAKRRLRKSLKPAVSKFYLDYDKFILAANRLK